MQASATGQAHLPRQILTAEMFFFFSCCHDLSPNHKADRVFDMFLPKAFTLLFQPLQYVEVGEKNSKINNVCTHSL